MPIKQAAFKALRQSKKRNLRNKERKDSLKKLLKQARRSIEDKKADEALELVKKSIKILDKLAQRGVIKKNTASRKKSRLVKKLNSIKNKNTSKEKEQP